MSMMTVVNLQHAQIYNPVWRFHCNTSAVLAVAYIDTMSVKVCCGCTIVMQHVLLQELS